MKNCPYCAEDIQDAAVVCKHCGRDLRSAGQAPKAPVASKRGISPALSYCILVVVAILAGGYILSRRADANASSAAVAQSGGPGVHVPQPVTSVLTDTAGLSIAAEHFQQYTFKTRAAACHVKGRVEGLAGGSQDVKVYVLTADDLANFKSATGNSATDNFGLYQSPQQKATTFDVTLPTAGDYALVVSNAFSVLTDKVVSVKALVVCTI